MIDFASLTHEELDTLCGWIGERAFKDYFEKNQRTLVRIYRDCRVKKLSMTQICDIVYRNRAEEFIVQFLDNCSQQLLSISQKLTEDKIASECDAETALIEVLADSPFTDNTPLYFKLRDEGFSDDYVRMTAAAVALLKRQTEAAEPEHETVPETNQTVNSQLQSELEDQSHRIAELEQQLDVCRSETEQTKNALSSYQIKEKRLHQVQRIVENYEDPEYQYLSICRVTDYRLGDNPHSLERLADVINGLLVPFEENPTEPRLFANRDRLFIKDGPDKIDYFGVWNWKAVQNWNDPTKDYVITKYNQKCFPIEIVEAPESNSLKELVSVLNTGLSDSVFCNRMLWCFRSTEGYIGILVERKQLNYKGDRLFVAPDVIELPVYVISTDDTILLGSKQKMLFGENQKLFLRSIDPGIPADFIKLYDPIDLMRKMLLDRASWSSIRVTNINKSQWQQFRSFLEKMPTEGLLEEFSSKCGCSKEEAEQYLSALLSQADQYLDGQDISTTTLVHAIQSSEKLSEYCAGLIRDDWEKKHFQEMTEAQQQLKQVQAEVLSEKAQLVDVRSRKAAIEVELRGKESLAEGVEKRIADRIAAAKQDAAQFISEMAFCTPIQTQLQKPVPSSVLTVGEQAENDNSLIRDYDYLLGNIQDELIEAGIDPEKALALGAFLYAAYCNRVPVLLVGPNSLQIANVMSVSLTGNTISTINCNQEYVPEWAQEIETHDIKIVAFRNPFRHDWIHPIMEQLEAPRRFFILLHPFAEDLCMEPTGLLNYMLPVLTEAFVSEKATGKYTASIFAEDFKHYEPQKLNDRLYSRTLKKLFSQVFLRKNIQQLITDLRIILPEVTPDMELQLGIIPSAYIINNGEKLLTALEAGEKDTKQSQCFLRSIMGKDE